MSEILLTVFLAVSTLLPLNVNGANTHEKLSRFRFHDDSSEIFGNFKSAGIFPINKAKLDTGDYFTKQGIIQSPLETTMMHIPKCSEDSERYDSKTGKCYRIGTDGPCGPFMIFTGNDMNTDDKVFGHCECDSDSYARPLVFVRDQCHFLYTQANCPLGHWLIASEILGTVCKPNPCESKMLGIGTDYIYMDGNCVQLGSPSKLCKNKSEIVKFTKGSLKPICGRSKVRGRLQKRQISKVNALKCQPGTIWSRILHKCRPVLQSKVIRD